MKKNKNQSLIFSIVLGTALTICQIETFKAQVVFSVDSQPTITKTRIPTQSTDVSLETPNGTLSGTLLLPSGDSPFPVVLIVAGSGQTDRDGNSVGLSGKSDCLKMLAEGLAKKGIASLRYDKRGVARSASARLATNLFETQVDDAAKWVEWLSGHSSRFRSIGIIGHSEGSLIAILAAQRGKVRALVSLAGAAKPFDQILAEQMEQAEKAKQISSANLAALKKAVTELHDGHRIQTRPPDIPEFLWTGLFQPRAQEYLISIFPYDPVAELKKLPPKDVKVQIIQGTTDLMGNPNEPFQLAEAIGLKPVLIKGMSHELKTAPPDPAGNDKASFNPKVPLTPELFEQMVPFLITELQ